MNLLNFDHVSRFTNGSSTGLPPRPILDGIDLELAPGEILALVGPSGAGKTTLLHLAAGLLRPGEGQVQFEGRDLSRYSSAELAELRRGPIGMIFQNNLCLNALSVRENVALPLMLRGESLHSSAARAGDLLGQVALGELADASTATLSGGQRQRMGIARAIAQQPRLLLADEPTADLDEATATAMEELLFSWLRESGCGALIVTHSLSVERRADRVLRIENGRMAGVVSV